MSQLNQQVTVTVEKHVEDQTKARLLVNGATSILDIKDFVADEAMFQQCAEDIWGQYPQAIIMEHGTHIETGELYHYEVLYCLWTNK